MVMGGVHASCREFQKAWCSPNAACHIKYWVLSIGVLIGPDTKADTEAVIWLCEYTKEGTGDLVCSAPPASCLRGDLSGADASK